MSFNNVTISQEGISTLLTYNNEMIQIYKEYLEAAKKLSMIVNVNKENMGADEDLVVEKVAVGLAKMLVTAVSSDDSTVKKVGIYSKNESIRIATAVYKRK